MPKLQILFVWKKYEIWLHIFSDKKNIRIKKEKLGSLFLQHMLQRTFKVHPPWLYVYLGKIFFWSFALPKTVLFSLASVAVTRSDAAVSYMKLPIFVKGAVVIERTQRVFLRKTKGYLGLLSRIERSYVTGKWQLYLFSYFRERNPKDQKGKQT